jgi:DNA-binding transcriptional regulator YdaS (Cro superfamily)
MKTADAVRFFGTKAALARALGIERQSLTRWGRTVPQRRQYELERITRGALRAQLPTPLRAAK